MSDLDWYTRNEDGFWCNICGNCLRPSFRFDDEYEWDEYEKELETSSCKQCGAPDDIDPEAI